MAAVVLLLLAGAGLVALIDRDGKAVPSAHATPTASGAVSRAPSASDPSPSASASIVTTGVGPGQEVPGFVITRARVTDLRAADEVTYSTVVTKGFAPAVAPAADASLARLSGVDLDQWRNTSPDACDPLAAPCGWWEESAREVTCVKPYVCLLVEGAGVFPGMATSATTVATFVADPLTGASPTLAEVTAPGGADVLVRFLNEKLDFVQRTRMGLPCDDPTNVLNDPLTRSDVQAWLPTESGVKVWFPKYAVGPGVAGPVALKVSWEELAQADAYVELGQSGCTPSAIDEDGLPAFAQDGQRTAGGVLCAAPSDTLPDIVPGTDEVPFTRVLQILLGDLALYHGYADGIYDKATQSAVRAFQRGNRLVVDAQVGPRTWSALQQTICRNWG